MINNNYSSIIYDYVDQATLTLKDSLDMILVIGSSCSDKVIKNWSDIDVVLVLETINSEIIDKVKNISNSYDIKIGTTVYSRYEFNLKKIDPKTYYHLFLAQNNMIEIQYIKDNFNPPIISWEELKSVFDLYLNERAHVFKRYFLYDGLTKQQIREFYKSMYILMKTKLVIDGYFPKNYEEVFRLFAEKYNFDLFDYQKFIDNYKNDIGDYREQLMSSSKKLLKKMYN